ncbi:serine--tRNA ligase [archaeon]|jgi:seryl-tRNA synthetase|nr:serine--tRNA ligase [archaeon]MBT6955679.1 serine--tRNA ligase [archaeon]MBT7128758.1 serine--tRNA ligase [archaeon]
MIDIKLVREDPELVKANIKKKFQEGKLALVDRVLELDVEWRKEKKSVDDLKHERNEVSEAISELKKAGKDVVKKLKEAKEIPGKIDKIEEKAKKLYDEIKDILLSLPNIMDASVPDGKDEKDNLELRKWGEIRDFGFKPKGHEDIVEDLDLVDSVRGAKVAGSRFYYLKGDLVLLNQALQRFAMDVLIKKGFLPVQTPYMLNRAAVGGAVSLEDFEESIYKIDGEDLYLIGTSEHALAALHKDEVINVKEPIRYAGLSSCFRKEAGSHGKDTKGIFRVHRFEKIEQFVYCEPKDADAVFDEIIANQEEIFKLLGIPYRVVALCAGEFSGSMKKTHDLEGWFPAQGKYRELGSTSNASDYQARKMDTKYHTGTGRALVYTLNGTAITLQRTMCCFLENFQNEDGSISIPEILIPYMGGMKRIEKK